MPTVATLRFARPDVGPELSDEELAERVAAVRVAREGVVRNEHPRAGVPLVGVKRVRQQLWRDRPRVSHVGDCHRRLQRKTLGRG